MKVASRGSELGKWNRHHHSLSSCLFPDRTSLSAGGTAQQALEMDVDVMLIEHKIKDKPDEIH